MINEIHRGSAAALDGSGEEALRNGTSEYPELTLWGLRFSRWTEPVYPLVSQVSISSSKGGQVSSEIDFTYHLAGHILGLSVGIENPRQQKLRGGE